MANATIGILAVLVTYSVFYNLRHGIPTMISEMYYGAERTTRYVCPMLLVLLSFAMCGASMDKGVDCIAFVMCAGLMFVGVAPAYLQEGARAVHKCGACVAGAAAVVWALTAWPWAVVVGVAFTAAALAVDGKRKDRWLYWCEWGGIVCAVSALIWRY